MFKSFRMFLIILMLAINCYAQEYTIAQDFKFGICPITGEQIITEDGRILPVYRIVWFELDNGSRMPLPVSVQALNAITESDFERIMAWVRAGWMYEINKKKWTPQEIQNYKEQFFNLKIAKQIE